MTDLHHPRTAGEAVHRDNADLFPAAQPAQRVEPLVWIRAALFAWGEYAPAGLIKYHLTWTYRAETEVWFEVQRYPDCKMIYQGGDGDAAKAAAQADFDRRILSALEPAAQDGAEVERLQADVARLTTERDDAMRLFHACDKGNRSLRDKCQQLRAERDIADQALVDRYRDPKSGLFNFPGDVAKIVRALDERDTENAALKAENERLRAALQAELTFAEAVAEEVEIDAEETSFTVRVMPEGREVATRTWADVHAASRAALRAHDQGGA